MKKLLSILLICTMMFCLAACGKDNKNKDIELTSDNFEDYFNVNVKTLRGGKQVADPLTLEQKDSCAVVEYSLEGASSNFNYNDVEIEIKVTIKFVGDVSVVEQGKTATIESQYTIKTDISGNSENEQEIVMLDGFLLGLAFDTEIEYEIVSISGTLSPAD